MRVPKQRKDPRKHPATASDVSAAEVGRRAGCSKQLASRLLKRGFSPDEIVQRIKSNKEAAVAKSSNGSPGIPLLDLPALPVADGPSFAAAQLRKELALAQLREIEIAERRRTLIPVSYVKHWNSVFLIDGRQILEQGPSELQDRLAAESSPMKCKEILTSWIDRVSERFERLRSMWEPPFAPKVGGEAQGEPAIPVPPPAPPGPQDRLADYQQYVEGSESGELEPIPMSQRIASVEWLQEHPSFDLQGAFRILAKKRQWDADMAALLRRRGEWDLAPEPPRAA